MGLPDLAQTIERFSIKFEFLTVLNNKTVGF